MSSKIQEYVGESITVRFDGGKCIHSRNCVLGAPGVFQANAAGPWINPDNGTLEEIVAVAHSCPSGAITYVRRDGGPAERAPEINVVRVLENGPLAIHADIHIQDHEPVHRATLCRCGQSANKPFCDGAHRRVGFTATGEPRSEESEALEVRGGTLEITPFRDGPLGISGNVEICSGTGRTLNRTTKAALCRCGHSRNRPYCDGSHRTAGFTTG